MLEKKSNCWEGRITLIIRDAISWLKLVFAYEGWEFSILVGFKCHPDNENRFEGTLLHLE